MSLPSHIDIAIIGAGAAGIAAARRVLAAIPGAEEAVSPLDDTPALRLAQAFVQRKPVEVQLGSSDKSTVRFNGAERWLFLGGDVGVGKTIAATWLLAHWRDLGFFVRACDLAKLDDDLHDKAKTALVLLLDDLGDEYIAQSQFGTSRLRDLLVHRHAFDLPTVATMNMKRTEFAERFGERANDRLEEMGKFVAVVGASRRKKRG